MGRKRMGEPSDDDSQELPDPLLRLVDEFLDRAQRGEQPSIAEYCECHPALAEEIRDLFPTLVLMEDLQPGACSPEGSLESDLDTPDQIGDYRIIGEIGRGGMGVVYEAEQESLGRRVALKVLPSSRHSRENSRLRFQQEARAAAKMHHTNIVPVFEVGQEGEHAFYAMQLILGQSLDHIIEELRRSGSGTKLNKLGQPPSDQPVSSSGSQTTSLLHDALSESSNSKRRQFYRSVAKIGLQAADALAYAHARGVIHRDIKPSNLLLDAEGVIWVTDFGLAKIEEIHDQGLTQTGDFLGTLRYMPPERFQGKCDARADIYALGLTLYELVLQRPAFESSDRLKLIHLINHVHPIKPREIDPSIPKDLETILLKSIEKEPKERYRNARALEQDLQRFINDEPIEAQRTTLVKQAAYWARRNRGLASAIGGIALLLLVLFAGSTVVAIHQSKLRKTAETAQKVAERARGEADEARSLTERNLYFSQMSLAGEIIGKAAGTSQIKAVTDAWLPASQKEDLRGWEWFYLHTYCLEEVATLTTPQPSIPLDAAWSPDQTRVATAHSDKNIYVWDSTTGALIKTLKGHPNIVVAVAWNPDGKGLAACDDENNVWVWDLQSNQVVRKFKAPRGTLVEQVAWDPAGRQLAWSSDSTVYVWDRERRDEHPTKHEGGPSVITTLQWSSDGTQIAGSGWRQRKAVVWDVVGHEIVKGPFDATLVKWSREGHRIEGWLLAANSGDIVMYEPNAEAPIQRFHGHTTMPRFMSWGAGGDWFLSASADQTVRVWEVESGEQIRLFQGHSAEVSTARFNRDSTRVISTSHDNTAKIWNTRSHQKRRIQTADYLEAKLALQDRPATSSLSWRPGENHLAVVGTDAQLRVWDTAASKVISKGGGRHVESVSWSPNGKWLALDELEGAGPEEYLGEEYISKDPGVAILRSFHTTGEQLSVVVPHPQRCNGIAWSPDARTFATICNDKAVRIWGFPTQTLGVKIGVAPIKIAEHSGHLSRPSDIQWNPVSDDQIATCDETGVIKIWDGEGERWTLTGHRGQIHQLSWSPDGEHLASAGQDGTVRIWDTKSGHQVTLLTGHHNAVFSVAWSPLGSRIATGSRDSMVKIWEPLSGTEALSLPDHQGAVLSVAWSHDGKQLATADITGAIIIWDARRSYDEELR